MVVVVVWVNVGFTFVVLTSLFYAVYWIIRFHPGYYSRSRCCGTKTTRSPLFVYWIIRFHPGYYSRSHCCGTKTTRSPVVVYRIIRFHPGYYSRSRCCGTKTTRSPVVVYRIIHLCSMLLIHRRTSLVGVVNECWCQRSVLNSLFYLFGFPSLDELLTFFR